MKRMVKMSRDGVQSKKTENSGQFKAANTPFSLHAPVQRSRWGRDCGLPLGTLLSFFLSNQNLEFSWDPCSPTKTTFFSLSCRLTRPWDLSFDQRNINGSVL